MSNLEVVSPESCSERIDNFIRYISRIVSWGNAILVAIIILQVVLRYVFHGGLVIFEELQWHLYAVCMMFGVSSAMVENAHVRVDIVHMRLSKKAKARVEIFGIFFFLIPFLFVIIDHSFPFVAEAWRVSECSPAPMGLPWRWAIKAVIPVSFLLLALSTVSVFLRSVADLRRKDFS